MANKHVHAIYDDDDKLLSAVKILKSKGVNINDVFKTRSSNTNEDIIYILGTISNNHPELSFVINKVFTPFIP